MSIITIVGAGMMGSALCWPLVDNEHTVRLVGTPLDDAIIAGLKSGGPHPKMHRTIPEGVEVYRHTELEAALDGAQVIASGVSSFGVEWFAESVGPLLQPGTPVIAVTKGLEDQPDGSLLVLPEATRRRLPYGLQEKASLNAIAGPCIAHELAARRQTGVVFCGADADDLERLRRIFATPYYHVWTSTDVVGVEVCAAMKNAYALGVGLAVGMMEKAGPDGLANMYNPQAALFGQSISEMRRLLEITGGGVDNVAWLPGPGDLYVTVFGGRTVRLGKLLGQGYSFEEASQVLAGETLESVEITTRVARALPRLAERGLARLEDFPLLLHLDRILNQGEVVDIPWDSFFPALSAYLTIDVGTSSAKVTLFHPDGSAWLGRGAAYPILYPHAGWAEQDPRLWWQAACELSRAVLAEAGDPPVRAVCVSGQAPLCVPVDRSGEPLRPAILWLDRRAQPQADWLRERLGLEAAVHIGGNTLDPYFGGVKWLWYRQAEPELYRRTWKILQAHSYINYHLTGEAATDPSHAGMCSPCFNLRGRAWDEDACRLMEIELERLPAIRPSAEVIGGVTRAAAQASGIPAGTPVVCGGGDFACACLGAGLSPHAARQEGSSAGSAAMMLGTAGNLLVPGLERTDPRLINTVHLTGEGLSLGGVLAGEAAGWFREMLAVPQEGLIEALEQEAAQVPAGADGLVFLPYLLGERTPVWDSRARGVFFGLAASHRRGALYRAVLEGVAYAFRQMGEILAECGRPLREVIAINGGARSPLWRQIMADVLGVPLRWRPTSGGTALGAAWLAALGAGDVQGFDGLSAWLEPPIDTLPDPSTRAVYASRYAIYRQLYARVKDLF